MTIILQQSLFSINELLEMESTQKYDAYFSVINLDKILVVLSKKSIKGAPVELNYASTVISLIVRIIERIPTIKDLIKRLNEDLVFKMNCGFLVSDNVPSEATYSRIISKLSDSNILEEVQEQIIKQAILEGFIIDDTIAIDSTHFEAKDKAPKSEKKENLPKKKRGRKSKEEKEKFLIEQANLPIFEKKIED